jgi:photosystem II stability/assembly factor-like uncharacterized protein
VALLDIAFTDTEPKHGFLVGTKQTLLETVDGGKTWEPRYIDSVDEEGINYRYNSISFHGDEGWIVGKPGVRRACSSHQQDAVQMEIYIRFLGPVPEPRDTACL